MKEYLRSDGDSLAISYMADEAVTEIIYNVYDLDIKDYIQADQAESLGDGVFSILLSQDVCKYDRNLKIELQIISINQASGFQQFVISLALRLCLFGNNKTICKQLYIDEGFVSFDKYNLSIVPNFLRSLLAYFDTIIIVSHIDLIQETIEDNECIAEINYNSTTSVSSITYKKILDIASICKANKKKISV